MTAKGQIRPSQGTIAHGRCSFDSGKTGLAADAASSCFREERLWEVTVPGLLGATPLRAALPLPVQHL
jgi:hypothetical protein